MKYDADYYCCENFVPKFKKLLDVRYNNLKEHKRRIEFEKDYLYTYHPDEVEKNKIHSSINQWFSYRQRPSIEKLINICELLDCDIDYFLTDQMEFKQENINAIQKTGLEEITIEEISELSISEKHIIDAMFSRTNASSNFLELIQRMLFYSHPQAKNSSYITLDKELTSKDDNYSKLEKEVNSHDILEILSYRLGIEMNEIIKSLSNDKELTNEILLDYQNKYFSPHRKVLSVEELPHVNDDGEWELVPEIGHIENKILDRLTERDEIGNHFDYCIEWLHNASDFSTMIKEKRSSMSKDDYRVWLNEIERKTR